MIIHRLIIHNLRHGDDHDFYTLQAKHTIGWLENTGVPVGPGISTLDLGCGHGIFGMELIRKGCKVTFADEVDLLTSDVPAGDFRIFNIEKDDFASLGRYDLVICSNVMEHLCRPRRVLESAHQLLKSDGRFFLSWTNWLSPWGGHEFSPFHYLGPSRGPIIYDKLVGRRREHTPFENLFPTYIGRTLEDIERNRNLRVLKVVPRYYPELAFITRIPVLREFFTWNCAILAQRAD